jgi:hypothetical protein
MKNSEATLPTGVPVPLLVDLEQAGKILGLKKASVRALIAREDLPAIRIDRGGKYFVPRIALEKFAAGLR